MRYRGLYYILILVLGIFPASYGQESSYTKEILFLSEKIDSLSQIIENLELERKKEIEQSELEALLNKASSLASQEKEEEATVARVFRGGERQLQALNPNISLTGDFTGSVTNAKSAMVTDPGPLTDGRNRFFMREAEFHIIAPLDPFTRGKFFLGIPGGGDEPLEAMIGEAYMEWLNFPGNINLKIGLFNTQFGVLNRWHNHGLPQVDRPKALVNLFGLENFGGMGIGANILLPRLWAHVNELDIEVVTGGDGISFDEKKNNVIVVSHLKNYWDLTRNTYLELGLSGAHGFNQIGLQKTTLAGVDLTVKWSPADRSHYRTIEFRNELFLSHRGIPGGYLNRFGFYSYCTSKMGAWSWIGFRIGYSENPIDQTKYEWDLSSNLDFWQSEFVMLRIQYTYTYRNDAENDHTFFVQSVWSMGPHKHEAY
ncbi:hypothetical protein JW824_08165 [bacterium]|nr:hypothetical protein [bacterium]